MKRLLVCTTLLAAAATLSAQQTPPKAPPKSPAATETLTIDVKSITITYSSPRVNGRAGHIFTKDGLISHDKTYPVWRAGANAATILQTDADLDVGDPSVRLLTRHLGSLFKPWSDCQDGRGFNEAKAQTINHSKIA